MRYSRQMVLPEIGLEGQNNLITKKVVVAGAGGIGSTVLMYLCASGIQVDTIDFDNVEISNLHRYFVYFDKNAQNYIFPFFPIY